MRLTREMVMSESLLRFGANRGLRPAIQPVSQCALLIDAEGSGSAFNGLGLDEQPSFAGAGWGEHGDTYLVRWGKSRLLLDRHLKKGNSREERFCFRLYFTWMDEDQHVLVGWLPSHLDTRAT